MEKLEKMTNLMEACDMSIYAIKYRGGGVHILKLDEDIKEITKKVKELLKTNEPNMRNEKEETPLLYLAKQMNYINEEIGYRLIKMLLENGADIHARDMYGNTVLHALKFSGGYYGEKVIEYILEKGVDIDGVNNLNRTALMNVVERYTESNDYVRDQVELLLKRGARTDIRDHKGKTVLDIVREAKKRSYKLEGMILGYGGCIKCKEKDRKIERLEKEIEMLKVQIRYTPGGEGYEEAKKEFEEIRDG